MLRQRPDAPAAGVELPVTPMLDMTFQLLVFFIITYHPSSLEGQMDFALPTKAAAPDTVKAPAEEPPGGLATPNPVTVVARAEVGGRAGALSALLVQTLAGEAVVNDADGLRAYLGRLRKADAAPEEVWLQVEDGLKYAVVVRLMDACKEAGFSRVSFVSSRAAQSD